MPVRQYLFTRSFANLFPLEGLALFYYTDYKTLDQRTEGVGSGWSILYLLRLHSHCSSAFNIASSAGPYCTLPPQWHVTDGRVGCFCSLPENSAYFLFRIWLGCLFPRPGAIHLVFSRCSFLYRDKIPWVIHSEAACGSSSPYSGLWLGPYQVPFLLNPCGVSYALLVLVAAFAPGLCSVQSFYSPP